FYSLFSTDAHHLPVPHSFPTRRSSDLDSERDSAAAGGSALSRGQLRIDMDDFLLSPVCFVRVRLSDSWVAFFIKRDYAREPGCRDRKSTRLNSSHRTISYAVFCLKKKK